MVADPNKMKLAGSVAQFIAAGFFCFAACLILLLVVMTARLSISPAHLLMMGGFTVILIGYGSVLNKFATEHVLLPRTSGGMKLVAGGAVAMLCGMAF